MSYNQYSSSAARFASGRADATVSDRRARVPGQGRPDPKLQTQKTLPTGQPVGFFMFDAGRHPGERSPAPSPGSKTGFCRPSSATPHSLSSRTGVLRNRRALSARKAVASFTEPNASKPHAEGRVRDPDAAGSNAVRAALRLRQGQKFKNPFKIETETKSERIILQ